MRTVPSLYTLRCTAAPVRGDAFQLDVCSPQFLLRRSSWDCLSVLFIACCLPSWSVQGLCSLFTGSSIILSSVPPSLPYAGWLLRSCTSCYIYYRYHPTHSVSLQLV